jgi:uncharacterized protein (TIGR00369 family)
MIAYQRCSWLNMARIVCLPLGRGCREDASRRIATSVSATSCRPISTNSDSASRNQDQTIEYIEAFMKRHFPQSDIGGAFVIECVGPKTATMRLRYREQYLRPGGTISGPSMFALADFVSYVAVIGEVGVGDDLEQAHHSKGALSVTTSLNINFLRKPSQCDLIATAKLIKLGKSLAVADIGIISDDGGSGELVAQAIATYSIPKS